MDRHRRASPESHYRHYAYAGEEEHQASERQGRKRPFDLRDTIKSVHMSHSYTRPQEGVFHFRGDVRGDEGRRFFQERDISPVQEPPRKKEKVTYTNHPLGRDHSNNYIQLAQQLYGEKKSLGIVEPDDERLAQFSDNTCQTASLLMLEAFSYSNTFAASQCRHVLLAYAEIFYLGKDYETALYWYWILYTYQFKDMTEQQLAKLQTKLAISMDKTAFKLFSQQFSDIRSSSIPRGFQLLMDVCKNKYVFRMMEEKHQSEFMACIYRYAVNTKNNDVVEDFIDHFSLEDITTFKNDDMPKKIGRSNVYDVSGWTCRILWPAFISITDRYKAREIVEFVREVAADKERISQENWFFDTRVAQSYHTLMVKTLKFFLLEEEDDDIQQAESVLAELREHGNELYISQKRLKLTLCEVLRVYGNILLRHEKVVEAHETLLEVKQIEQDEIGEIQEITKVLEAEIDRLEYEKGAVSEVRDATKVKQHIEYFSTKFDPPHTHHRDLLCLAKLYLALGEKENVEKVLQHYKGKSNIGYRLRAMNLNELGRCQEAVDILKNLEQQDSSRIYLIQHECAICLSHWSRKCSGKDKTDKLKKAMKYFDKAIVGAPIWWRKGWAGFGHICQDIKEQHQEFNFKEWKENLTFPLCVCKNWGAAASRAFFISKSYDIKNILDFYQKNPLGRIEETYHAYSGFEGDKREKGYTRKHW